jgi:hypothetical protein
LPDLGLTKAIGRAVRKGTKGSKVLRPAEEGLIAKEAAANAPTPKVPEPELAPIAAAEEAIPPPQDPAAPRVAPEAAPAVAADPAVAPAVVDEPAVTPMTPAQQTQVSVDAFGIDRARLGDFDLDESYQPNFDQWKTTDDIKATIARQSHENAGQIDEARRGIITNEQLTAFAGDLDLGRDVVRAVLERESGGVLSAEVILESRKVLLASATLLKNLGTKVARHQASNIEKVQFARQLQLHNEFHIQFMGARAETGRALNAFRIPVGGDEFQLARMSELLMSAGNLEKTAIAISRTDSVTGVTKVAKPGLFARSYRAGQGFINHVFVNGILSGPTTHLVNIIGNVLFQAMNTAEIALAARLGRFLGPGEHVQAGEALATLHGSLSAYKDAFRLAGKALKEGKSLDDMVKYEANPVGRDITSQLPGLDKPYLGATIRGIETALGLPTRALGAEDDFFKTIAYRGYVERQTLLHVQQQIANGTASLENAAQVARQFMENPGTEIQAAAEDWARQMTFQTPLGQIGMKAQLFLRSVPALTLIAPFIRTPVNIFKEGIARSPLALFSARFWTSVRKGGVERDLALTRFALGSATATYVAYQTTEGNVTGAGPQNPSAKLLWEANGRRPYSIRVTNPITGEQTWHSYARMEPIASVIGATADTVEILSYLGDDPEVALNDDQEAYKAAGAIIAAIMNNTGNKTFMKGVSDFVELTNDPTRNIRSWSNQMGASLVPYSALARSIRNIEDPYLREAWTLIDKVADNTPGYSKDLPLRLGLFGEPREKNSGSILGAMSPLPESKQGNDEVIDQLTQVMEETRLVPATMPSKNIDGMRLTAQEYGDYVRIARSEPIFGKTRTYYDELQRTINLPAYRRATSQGKYDMLKAVQNMADQMARVRGGPLEQQNPDYAERINEWRLEQNRLRFGQ